MTSPFGVMTLICNAGAGRGKIARALPAIRSAIEDRGLEYEFFYTEQKGHATQLAHDAVGRGGRYVVAVGGDGTVHEVVNGVLAHGPEVGREVALGVVACGSGCDFIRTFGLPPDPVHAVRHLDGPQSFPIDIGRITFSVNGDSVSRYFVNISDIGLTAAAVAQAERLPRWLGPTRYFFAFWLALRKHRIAKVKIDLVDRTYEGYMNNLVVANGQYFGGGVRIAPKATPTDGVFDVQIEHARRREALAMLPKVFKGEHLPHPDIEEAKRVKVSIESDRPLRVEADGEVLGYTPASFEVVREAIRLKV